MGESLALLVSLELGYSACKSHIGIGGSLGRRLMLSCWMERRLVHYLLLLLCGCSLAGSSIVDEIPPC
jgi:hypothetical protein